MYATRSDVSFISLIQNPNDSALACNFLEYGMSIYPGKGGLGLPNFYNTINIIKQSKILYTQTGCNSYRFTFTSTLKGNTVKQWSFGDGTQATDSIVTHTYSTATDSVLIKFKIYKPGTTDTLQAQQWLRLSKKPVVSFQYQTSGCINDSVKYISAVTGYNNINQHNYNWSFGDGTIAALQNPAKKYADTGTYTVKLFASDSLGCTSDTISKVVAVNKKAVSNFALSAPACNNAVLQFTSNAASYNTSISQWKYFLSNNDSVISNTNGNVGYLFDY
jgi:PKD repeat protein